MPPIAAFYGIVSFIYSREHGVPHFHARHGDHEAVVAIDSGEVLTGGLPRREAKLVAQWWSLHQAELADAWRRGSSGHTLYDRAAAMTTHSHTPEVVGVAVTRPHVMRLLFDDGVIRDVQFTPSDAHGPMVLPLNDPDYFARVTVDQELRTVVWPNGLDLAPEVLHGDYEPENPIGFRDITPADLAV